MRKLCKTEDIRFSPYNKLADFRADLILSSEIFDVINSNSVNIGIGISYQAV